ncbi:hypothetical protein [Streptomyces sp. NPDC051993]|uniref:hypothetical protein n=1 Tax=Streptomyces sp. NPDC051993 TaxID=3155286 RepID=UPI00343CA2DF
MFKLPRTRRAMAMTAAVLALAGGATVTTAGTAQAYPLGNCGDLQGITPGAPWYSWSVRTCSINEDYPYGNTYVADVTAYGGSTDVRVYVGLYDSCNGVTYALNGDSDANHFFPSSREHRLTSAEVDLSCPSGVWAIARIFNNGQGSPWVWSRPM